MTARRVGLQPHAVDEAELRAAERVIAATKKKASTRAATHEEGEAPPQTPYSFRLTPATVDSVRDAVVYLETLTKASAAGLTDKKAPKKALGMSEFVDAALVDYVNRMAKRYNGGEAFPARSANPKPGRRVGQ